jgi:hypothetical protein
MALSDRLGASSNSQRCLHDLVSLCVKRLTCSRIPTVLAKMNSRQRLRNFQVTTGECSTDESVELKHQTKRTPMGNAEILVVESSME